ncbi:baseplate J/gp47 family protein [Moorena sp. SIO3A2]|uniref:baseplate J/gp47 family protein n=1 Tax=Moorena sp. SIO3A2 TaxID=2607841 RepID=UPI0013BC32FE|nr:baseplate J/gp47 family protein [Moorena sp. SIO3A2]NER90376.1 hypothetical protein [Moorena sp. SIO3A2]
MAIPPITDETIGELVEAARLVAIEKSQGRLRMPPLSPATVIVEAMAVVAVRLQELMNTVAQEVEANRLAIFGFERSPGRKAVGRVEIRLRAIYSTSTQIGAGFPLTIGGVDFETTSEAVIGVFESSTVVGVQALEVGIRGNQPFRSIVGFTDEIPQIESIELIGETLGGVEPETEEEWREYILSKLRVRALVSEEDFELEAIDHLGRGSTAVAIARMKPDRTIDQNGYVHVFAINPFLTPLNREQMQDLQDALSRKAAMAVVSVSNMEIEDLSIVVYAYFTGNANAIAREIRSYVINYFAPTKRTPGEMVLNKGLEFGIQNIAGIKPGLISVQIDGLEQPRQLPNEWTLAHPLVIEVELLDDRDNLFKYSFDQPRNS